MIHLLIATGEPIDVEGKREQGEGGGRLVLQEHRTPSIVGINSYSGNPESVEHPVNRLAPHKRPRRETTKLDKHRAFSDTLL